MIYCVVPKELADDLYPKLVEYYSGDENVRVVVERRAFDRRARRGATADGPPQEVTQRRIVRDRRRARVAGDLLPLADG
jgi:hypothetical protein